MSDHRSERGAPRRAKRPRKKSGSGALAMLIAFGAAPVGLLIYYLTRSKEQQQQFLDNLPEGMGGRAIKAVAAIALLVALARLALPAVHGSSAWLQGILNNLREAPTWKRVLMFPVELVVGILWLTVQLLFAIDAVLILLVAAAALLLVVRIFKPDFLPDVLTQF